MKCEICKKANASFYRYVPSRGENLPVCVACLSRISAQGRLGSDKQVGGVSGFDLIADTLMNFQPAFTDFYSASGRAGVRNTSSVVCPNCGFEFNDYFETGRFGCVKCYDVFHDKIVGIVRQIHGCTRHNGSRPNRARSS